MSRNWFIALRVPAGEWFDRITDPPGGLRIFHPDDLHMTVAFLGPVDRDAADAAFALAPKWPTRALDITLSHIEPMGNPRHPNALAAQVGDRRAELNAAIATVRDDMCRRAGARTEDRPPRAHVTVARLRRKSGKAEVSHAIAWAKAIDLGNPAMRLTELVLYRGTDAGGDRLFAEHDVSALPP